MARVVLQAGHVARKTGATGTTGEQPLNTHVCELAAAKLRAYGHSTRVILADEVYGSAADVFIAHHADGSTNVSASGASVGYPDKAGGELAHQFKIAYAARGWPYGFRADNYTPGLRGYYAYSRHDHIRRRMVVEAGFMTNPVKDRPWIDANHGVIAQAIADAVNAVYGTPTEEDDMPLSDADVAKIWLYRAPAGGVMRDYLVDARNDAGSVPQRVWDQPITDVAGVVAPARARLAATDVRARQILEGMPAAVAAELGDVADPAEVEAAVRRVIDEQFPDSPPAP